MGRRRWGPRRAIPRRCPPDVPRWRSSSAAATPTEARVPVAVDAAAQAAALQGRADAAAQAAAPAEPAARRPEPAARRPAPAARRRAPAGPPTPEWTGPFRTAPTAPRARARRTERWGTARAAW